MHGSCKHHIPSRVNSQKAQYGPVTTYACFCSSLGSRVGGESYSNFLASSVLQDGYRPNNYQYNVEVELGCLVLLAI